MEMEIEEWVFVCVSINSDDEGVIVYSSVYVLIYHTSIY